MFKLKITPGASKSVLYRELTGQVAGLLADETDWLANTANVAALIHQGIPGLNWAGFYFLRGGELVLGPFQGKVACVRIKLDRGVCGAAARRRETVVVPDVEKFPGHIACDHASRSEIVVPLIRDGALIGVLDLDSPHPAHFDHDDAEGLRGIVAILLERTDFRPIAAADHARPPAAQDQFMSAEFNLNTVVAYWDVDRDNLLGLPAVFKLLQEAAIKHADQFDAGTRAMETRGESWVLNRIAVEIRRYPRYEEAVRVHTWSSGIRTFKGYRDFRVYCGEELVLSGSSLWLYFDMKTKSLIRVPDEVARSFPGKPGQEFRPGLEKIRLAAPAVENTRVCRISVRHSDLDGNGHVNNTTTFDMLQTALARAGQSTRPQAVEAQFLKEISPEVEWVDVRLEQRDSGSIFSISTPEGPCVLGRFAWAEPTGKAGT